MNRSEYLRKVLKLGFLEDEVKAREDEYKRLCIDLATVIEENTKVLKEIQQKG